MLNPKERVSKGGERLQVCVHCGAGRKEGGVRGPRLLRTKSCAPALFPRPGQSWRVPGSPPPSRHAQRRVEQTRRGVRLFSPAGGGVPARGAVRGSLTWRAIPDSASVPGFRHGRGRSLPAHSLRRDPRWRRRRLRPRSAQEETGPGAQAVEEGRAWGVTSQERGTSLRGPPGAGANYTSQKAPRRRPEEGRGEGGAR